MHLCVFDVRLNFENRVSGVSNDYWIILNNPNP